MSINKTPSVIDIPSHDRPLFEQDIGAYKTKGKLVKPTVCPQCSAVYMQGR